MDRRDELMLGPAEYREVLKFYSGNKVKTDYFCSRARGFLANGRKQWACASLYSYLFIDFDGKVYPCEIISEAIGDVRKQNLADIWNSPSADDWRNRIGKLACCHTCNEPGAVRYSAYTEGFSYLKFLLKLGGHKFRETLYGEGFSKYFGK